MATMRSLKVGVAAAAALFAAVVGAPAAGAVPVPVPTCGYWSDPSPNVSIGSAQDLNALAYCVANNPVKADLTVTVIDDFTASEAVTPIGTPTTPFIGTFNGNDKTITGLTVTGGGTDYQGLFGAVGDGMTGGVIRNVRLVNPTVGGAGEVGALVGRMAGGTISAVRISGATVTGTHDVGMAIGMIFSMGSVTITGVAVDGAVQGSSYNVGGLAGRAQYHGSSIQIDGATTNGTVTGNTGVGGILGGVAHVISPATVELRNAGSRARVIGVSTGNGYGGIIGYVSANLQQQPLTVRLERVYATGEVQASVADGTGGIIGSVGDPQNVTVVSTQTPSLFWDTQATGKAAPIDTRYASVLTGMTVAKTAAELKARATYAGWPIAALETVAFPPSLWTICSGANGGYPFLRALPPGGCLPPGAPTNLVATPGNGSYRIAFTAPAAGDAPITGYEYSLDGQNWDTAGPVGPIFFEGTNDQTVVVRLRAVSVAGAGPASDPVSVTPGPCVGGNGRALTGRGTAASPYLVGTAADLRAVGTGTCGLRDAYRQVADITMPAATTVGGVTSNFTPIGTVMDPFAGVYDGQGFAIDGLVFDDPTASDVGLFGSVADVGPDPAVVRNVRVTAARVVGTMHVGAIVGLLDARNRSVQVEDVSSTGSVTGSTRVGGLIGRVLSLPADAFGTPMATVSGLTSTAAVTAASSAGGAIGMVDVSDTAGASVSDVATSGVVTATGSGAGGIVGRVIVSNAGLSAPEAVTFTDLIARSPISAEAASRIGGVIGSIAITGTTRAVRLERAAATSHYLGATSEVGGLIGYVSRSATGPEAGQVGRIELKDAYATVPLLATAPPATTFGGLIGRLEDLVAGQSSAGGVVDLERVYAAGPVPLGGQGLVGTNTFSTELVASAFWDREATLRSTSGLSGAFSFTTAQMNAFATYADAGWPIVLGWKEPTAQRVWGICGTGNGYPYLLSHADHAPCDFPYPPVDVVATPGDGSAVLTFSPGRAGDFPTTGYEYTLDYGQTVAGSVAGSPLTITGLRNGETVFVALRAVTDAGPGWWGQGVYVTPVAALSTPTVPSPPATPATVTRSPLRLQTPTVLAGGRVQVAIDVNGPGAIAMTATPTARAGRAACTTTRKVKAAGTYRLTCRLNRATRARLAKASIRLQVAVVFRPTKGAPMTQATTLMLARQRGR